MAELLRGMQLTKKGSVGSATVCWKQGSFVGIGGDRSQTYNIYNYETPQGGIAPVYIQASYPIPDKLVCDGKLQYGMNNGVFFFVYHDKSQKPFQHRFVQNEIQKYLYQANDWLKTYTKGYGDLSWASGDYLRDF